MAGIVGEVRRRLSVAAVKAQADCLLNRMSSIGKGPWQLGRGGSGPCGRRTGGGRGRRPTG